MAISHRAVGKRSDPAGNGAAGTGLLELAEG
jgi:hypothetical protein